MRSVGSLRYGVRCRSCIDVRIVGGTRWGRRRCGLLCRRNKILSAHAKRPFYVSQFRRSLLVYVVELVVEEVYFKVIVVISSTT